MNPLPRIVVVGSVNMDLVVRCPGLPTPGQTILAQSVEEIPGGKGANQAVAAARAGGDVTLVGRVGDDGFAGRLTRSLQNAGVSTTYLTATPQSASGIAIVAVDPQGENSIIVVPGANHRITPADIDAVADVIRQADCLLVQLEVPIPVVQAAIRIARDAKVHVIVDPAPMPDSIPDDLLNVDVICPNRTEAESITGIPIGSVDDAVKALAPLHDRGARAAIITLGPWGAVVSDGDQVQSIAPLPIRTIDSTAAGDAFAGAFAVRISEGASIFAAAQFASIAGAIAATSVGAQVAMPTRNQIDRHTKGESTQPTPPS